MKTLGSIASAVLLFLAICSSAHAWAAKTVITACGTIAQPGDYLLTSDLQLVATEDRAGDCLDVSASHVNLDLGGYTIYVFCPEAPFETCSIPSNDSVAAAVGINVLSGADYVTIRNGSDGSPMGSFETGIAIAADHATVRRLAITAREGIALTGSFGRFTGITYVIADESYHGSNGPVVSAIGNQNTFANVFGQNVGHDIGSSGPAIAITGNLNVVYRANVSSYGGCSYAIPISGKNNFVIDSTVSAEGGCGIGVTSGSTHNFVIGNSVTVIPNTEYGFAMFDENADCGSDLWLHNTFTNASPASCIR